MVTHAGGANDETFAAVLRAAQAGAGWAFTQLWNDYAPAVRAFLTARGSREPDDLTSEVFLTVFQRLPQLAGDAAGFRSFVFSIAYRRWVDELRARGRRGESVELDVESDPRRASSAEDDALERLALQRTTAVLNTLVADQRDVMLLRIVADLTVEQVAAVLGKSEGAVKALQRRALVQLKKKVGSTRTSAATSRDGGE